MRPLRVLRRLAANATRAARRGLARGVVPASQGFWLRLKLESPFQEAPLPLLLPGRTPPLSLLEALTSLRAAASDPRVDGVLVWLAGAPTGLGQAMALVRALGEVRAAGRPVVAYGETLGEEELVVASAADRIWMPESGSVSLVGLRLEGLYLSGLLEELGVRAEVVRMGEYKTAAEMFLRRDMSPEQREQLESLLEDRYAGLVDALARGRGLEAATVRARIDGGPYPARGALEAGLVDACVYADEFEERLEALTPLPPPERSGPRRIRFVDAPLYHALHASDPGWRPLLADLPRLAYVVASGAIRRGGGHRGVASDTYRGLLERLRSDPDVRGVVLRVESPGGDGLASDLLHRGLTRLREEKPVVVSMGEVAASGGYYLAAGADAVLAESTTVTGSIGVVGGKVNLAGLYERVGVSRDAVERGARAGMLSETRGFTPGERKALRAEMRDVYETFLGRVAQGRGLPLEAVRRLAGGRVWSGRRALEVGLVDRLGGPLEALAEVRRRAGLLPEERCLLDVHPRVPRLASLGALLGLVR